MQNGDLAGYQAAIQAMYADLLAAQAALGSNGSSGTTTPGKSSTTTTVPKKTTTTTTAKKTSTAAFGRPSSR